MKNNTLIVLGVLMVVGVLALNPNFLGAGSAKVFRPLWGSVVCEGKTNSDYSLDMSVPTGQASREQVVLGTNVKFTYVNFDSKQDCGTLVGSYVAAADSVKVSLYKNGNLVKEKQYYIGSSDVSALILQDLNYQTFSQGDSVKIGVKCVGTLLFSEWDSEDYVDFIMQGTRLQLVKYMDGAQYGVSPQGYDDCINTVASTDVKEGYVDKAKALWQAVGTKLGTTTKGVQTTSNTVQTVTWGGQTYQKLNTYRYFVYDWKEIDTNLNPVLKDKDGQSVICDKAVNELYKLDTITTVSGLDYTIPTEYVRHVQCCSNADCTGNGEICNLADTGKELFTCQKTANVPSCATPCVSDVNCKPDAQGQDSGGIFIQRGTCVTNCCKYVKSYVQCTDWSQCKNNPSYPESQYRINCVNNKCSYSKISDVKAACPAECCMGTGSFYEKKCSSGYCCSNGGDAGYCNPTADCKTPAPTTTIASNQTDQGCGFTCSRSLPLGIQYTDYACLMGCWIGKIFKSMLALTVGLVSTIVAYMVLGRRFKGKKSLALGVSVLIGLGLTVVVLAL